MVKQKLYTALLVPLISGMVGCGGSDGDNVNITNEFGSSSSSGSSSSGGSSSGGDCNQVVVADFIDFNTDCSVGTLTGMVDEDYTLTSDVQWRLDGTVTVGDGNRTVSNASDVQAIRDAGVTLTIEPGTDIRAFDTGTLLVTRGSMLMAEGSASQPITFSSLDDNYDGLGEWGGVIIQGFAPQYGQGDTGPCYGAGDVCNVEGEGGTDVSVYGGNDPADNSGSLRYVRIAEGGLVAGPNNEINGLTLQGVGYGTMLEYIQVHNNLDDGIEWFGGTVNLRYAVLTSNDDDDIDYDEGYMGNIQYALIEKNNINDAPQGSNDPRGVEANSSDADYVPQTEAVLANLTIIGGKVNNNASSSQGEQPGMRLRGAVKTAIFNSSVSNFNIGCVRIDNADVNGDGSMIVPSVIAMENFLGDCEGGLFQKQSPDVEDNVDALVLTYSETMAIQESQARLDVAPVINAVNNGSGFVFDQTDFIGAVDPDGDAWWEGWTLPGTVTEMEPVQPASFVSCSDDATNCTITGQIDQDYTMVAGVEWRLDGEVIVGAGNVTVANDADVQAVRNAGVTLTIRPGVNVRAFDTGSLIVTRGSKIHAVGSPAAPITFSSLSDDNLDGEGEWGGVIIQGFAPQYGQGGTGACFGTGTVCNIKGEGGTIVGNYGGNDPADDSGALRYVRIAEGGKIAGPNNEINGLTLQGVGYSTEIDYIQVHGNLDDGIEWFGGTVNATHLVLTNNDDDDIDYDEGYMGNIQYAIVRKNQSKSAPTGSNDPRGIEANSSDADFVPETDAVLANILVLGGSVNNNAASQNGQQPGMRLRGAVTTAIYNSAVRDFDTGCIRIDDAVLTNSTVPSNITLVNVPGECLDGYYDKRAADAVANAGEDPVTVDSAYALMEPSANVMAPGIPAVDNGSGFVFDNTDFIGAVKPGTDPADTWWAGWIIEGSLD
ncbi:MAG: hypothetical protein KDI33_14800 [Halioglobus sp.]|nr:hypothetical protein [Halioglobus sp.]